MSSTPPVPAVAAPAAAADARRVTAVVGVLALAVFMSSLDLFSSSVNTHHPRSDTGTPPSRLSKYWGAFLSGDERQANPDALRPSRMPAWA